MSLFNINTDIAPLTREIQEFKNNQQKQQAQIIALLEEIRNSLKNEYSQQNKLLKEILTKK
jgi:hypothetical protein